MKSTRSCRTFTHEALFVFQGFFYCIQAIQSKKLTRSIPELILAVKNAFYREQKKETLDNVFLSLQQSMIGALEANGDNTTKLKHIGKEKLRKDGNLPTSLTPDEKLIENSRKFLEHHRHILVTAARKKKAKEDMIDQRRFEAAVLKDERMMAAEEQRFEVALRKEERVMESEAKKAAIVIKKEATAAAREAKREATAAKKEATAAARAAKKEATAAKMANERKSKKPRVEDVTLAVVPAVTQSDLDDL